MRLYKADKGFTLIELLVVIAIIGILSSVVLASMNSARKKARDARRQADLKSLQLALESYYDSNSGAYPTVTVEAPVSSTTLGALVSQGFITVLPTDPSAGQSYYYISDDTGSSYCLGSKIEGTAPTPANTCGTVQLSATNADYMVGQ